MAPVPAILPDVAPILPQVTAVLPGVLQVAILRVLTDVLAILPDVTAILVNVPGVVPDIPAILAQVAAVVADIFGILGASGILGAEHRGSAHRERQHGEESEMTSHMWSRLRVGGKTRPWGEALTAGDANHTSMRLCSLNLGN